MSNEIFYLESCLAIEKSMEAVRESVRYSNNDFMFESSEGAFAKIKRKIVELIQKVKSIFTGSAMKKKDADAVKKAKSAKGGTVKVRDSKKLNKLYSSCRKDIKDGKDPEKVKARWKKGLVILGFATATAAAVGTGAAIKYRKAKDIKPTEVEQTLNECNKIVSDASKGLEADMKLIEHIVPGINTMSNDQAKRKQAQVLSELYSDFTKSVTSVKYDTYNGLGKVSIPETQKKKGSNPIYTGSGKNNRSKK